MASVFLFGAGASYGSGPCYPENPPLGRHLFEEMRKRGGVAAQIDGDLAATFRLDPEAGMDRLFDERQELVPGLLRQMASYLAEFEIRPGNYYAELLMILGGAKHKTVFATLNYDILLEEAICQAKSYVTYGLATDKKNISVLKIHGSCHFLPQADLRNFVLTATRRAKALIDAQVHIATSRDEVFEYCNRLDRDCSPLGPALSLYARGKKVLYSPTMVEMQQSAWKSVSKSAARIFLIGVKFNEHDSHIWETLMVSRAPLFLVEPFPDDGVTAWAKSRTGRKRPTTIIPLSFRDALPRIAARLAAG